jgi:hypothetical protein
MRWALGMRKGKGECEEATMSRIIYSYLKFQSEVSFTVSGDGFCEFRHFCCLPSVSPTEVDRIIVGVYLSL